MSRFIKNLFLAIATLLAIAVLFSVIAQPATPPEKLSLNEVVDRINKGDVTLLVVNGEEIAMTLKGDTHAIAKKEAEAPLTETLKNLGVDVAALQKVNVKIEDQSGFQFWASILIPSILPLLALGFIFWFITKQARSGVNQAFSFGRSNVKLSNFANERITFGDVAGLKEAKEELVEVVDFLKNPKKFLDLGAKIPRGVLLVGAPGTGKTLLARAVAGEANVPFFSISASEFVEMFVGVGASRTRDAFAVAKKASPSILFIDEIDAVGRQRGTGMGGGNDEREQTLNQILVELDGFDRESRVIVLAATNRPDILDPALLRPGRFDRHVVLDLPDINDREAILKIHSRDKKIGKDVDFKKVAVRTPGFAGADLANLMNEATIVAARYDKKAVEQIDLYNSIERVMLGPERKTRVSSKHEREITAYHEGGHALVAASIKDTDRVHKISIISRGMAGGYTLKLPMEDQRLKTKSQFLSDMAVMLGGFTSEKLTFDDVSTGASNDLKEASDIARKLVTKYGMSDVLGPMTFGAASEAMFLGREIGAEKNYSEEVAKKIDEEAGQFIARAHTAAKKILNTNKKALKAIAVALMERETLEQDDFYAILKPFKIKQIVV